MRANMLSKFQMIVMLWMSDDRAVYAIVISKLAQQNKPRPSIYILVITLR